MKAKWVLLGLSGAAVAASWSAAAIGYFFFDPDLATWTALLTAAALSLEVFFWVGAGVLGWSFLAGRRAALGRLRQRFFAGKAREHAD
jgi:hypothetical protein